MKMTISDNSLSENSGNYSERNSEQTERFANLDNSSISSPLPAQSKSNDTEQRRGRGFAAMSPERQKEIARVGGKAAHEQGVAHQWNSEEARNAGKKGGQSVSQNREHMSAIGRRGGQASGSRRNKANSTEGEVRE